MTYRIRLCGEETQILDVSFSQLVESYLPEPPDKRRMSHAERAIYRNMQSDFWTGKRSLNGPLGSVKLIGDTT